jgi:hypothetical protein
MRTLDLAIQARRARADVGVPDIQRFGVPMKL